MATTSVNSMANRFFEIFLVYGLQYHPDTNQGDAGSHARFVEIQQAYSVLSAPSKRHQYDLSLHANRTPSSSHSRPYRTYDGSGNEDGYHFNDEFKDFFYHRYSFYSLLRFVSPSL